MTIPIKTKTTQPKPKVDLWDRNEDYAVFLPSISGFYNTIVSKQQSQNNYISESRLNAEFDAGIEGFNFLNKEQAYFHYPWALYSAGHAQLDIKKSNIEESMVQKRDRAKTFIVGDSGGFQIAKGVIKFDWEHFLENPGDVGYKGSADKTRGAILNWLEHTADYSVVLDIPTVSAREPLSRRTGLTTFKECLDGTMHNNDWFIRNRQGKTKFLNVLQGSDNKEADEWYRVVKDLPFEGWGMGGNNMKDAELLLRRLIIMRDEKRLDSGKDLIHYLGTSRLEWAMMLTAVQRNLRKHVNPNVTITYDCASPFIATAHGQVYTQHVHRNNRFSYIMDKAVDSRSLSSSEVPFPWSSPIGDRMRMKDICWYAPGDVNKLGKETKTSWDTFSYFLMMAHNVYQHIESVQRANSLTDTACALNKPNPSNWRKVIGQADQMSDWVPRNVIYMVELVNRVFASETPFTELDNAHGLLAAFSGKKTLKTAAGTFDGLFDTNNVTSSDSDSDTYSMYDDVSEEFEQILADARWQPTRDGTAAQSWIK